MGTYIREPINGFTHLFGAVLSIFGLYALITKAIETTTSVLPIVAVSIFGISMILLYAASATYHLVVASDKTIAFLRKIDHSMIYVLIAGTYTPLTLITLGGKTGWILFIVIQSLALLGVAYKLIWFHSPRWLSTGLYISMGWIVVFFVAPLADSIRTTGILLLIGGGIIYTIGGIIYWLKPSFLSFKQMGFHEIFHLFILTGSLAHFLSIYFYVL
ncbi:hemolysin III family protein [Aquibacillus sp. 3ASR75-11]|uniref:Hemolysin III family protein n=1 Tax=Terrihalobacillus insolitus TaxID=2950438 RepID=A0A9X4AKE2_9BACI|nr:hemolysin III family protein [Terrihalobacillus insolitus]MDC3412311.1 hemolysin III family protein [Terrihalobacillus insolitus]MDC3422996.1 hemolysin III family protein [Terrihalobacillus insolitus]